MNGSQPSFPGDIQDFIHINHQSSKGQKPLSIDNNYLLQNLQQSPKRNNITRQGSRNPKQYSTIQYAQGFSKKDSLDTDENHVKQNHIVPRNHFKVQKKQSVQNYLSTSLVQNLKNNISNQGKLVSNMNSISQSQVSNLNYQKHPFGNGAQTLKSRYSRSGGRSGKEQRSISKSKPKKSFKNRVIGNSQIFPEDMSPGGRSVAQNSLNYISQTFKPGNFESIQSPQSQYEAINRIPQKKLLTGSIKARKNTTQVTSELYQAHNSGGVLNGTYISGGTGIKEKPPLTTEWVTKINKNQKLNFDSSSQHKVQAGAQFEHQISSPISILDNNAQYLTQISSENTSNIIQKQDSQNSMNLTQQIRKTNKIQIKKRFQQDQTVVVNEFGQFPESLLVEADMLLKQTDKSIALDKYLEYIKIQPLSTKIHFKVGLLYVAISEDESSQMDKVYATQEAILHFEQVVKHIHNNNGSVTNSQERKFLPAMSIFQIVQIHIKQMDFYQANFQLDRATHFEYQKLAEDEQSRSVSMNLNTYKKFVDAVILLMKQQVSSAVKILSEIAKLVLSPEYSKQNKFDDMKQKLNLKYYVLSYRAYGFIIKKSYKEAANDLNMISGLKEFDAASRFNLKLANLLQNKGYDQNKIELILKLREQFPENKDVIRYHAITLIQQQMGQDIDIVQKSRQVSFKERITQDLKNMTRNHKAPTGNTQTHEARQTEKVLTKCQSQAQRTKQQSERESQLGNLENQTVNTESTTCGFNSKFYEQIATSNVDHPQKYAVIEKSLKIVNQGLAFSPKDRNLLLTRSTLLFYLHNFYEALCDIDAVIDIERAASGEEEPNATDLLQKGRCHACLSMFKEAIEDFTKVIELDDELFDAYYYRGKCSYLIGDTSQAFLDFQKLILLQPKNPMVHAYAGNLLMTTGSYEDAAKAFTNADSVQPCAFAIYQRARCFLAIGDFKATMADLQKSCGMFEQRKAHGLSNQNSIALRDRLCLENIVSAMELLEISSDKILSPFNDYTDESQELSTLQPREESNQKHFSLMDLKNTEDSTLADFQQINSNFDSLLEMKQIELRQISEATEFPRRTSQASSENFCEITQDSRMQQQIIPNVTRIKIEKVRALRRAHAKQEMADMNRQKKKKSTTNMLVFNIDYDETDQRMKNDGQAICPWSYYMENLFSKDDLFLYRGVVNFYLDKQPEAIRDFKKSQRTKNMFKILDNETNQHNKSRFTNLDADKKEDLDDLTSDEDDKSDLPPHNVKTESQKLRNKKRSRKAEGGSEVDESYDSDQTDLSDIGLCSLNKHEMYFNVALSMIQMGKYRRALKILDTLNEKCPHKYAPDIQRLSDIVQQWLKAPDNTEDEEQTNEEAEFVEPFGASHRLCRFFPWVKFESKSGQGPTFLARPSFSFPFVKPPNMIPNVDESLLYNEFGPEKEDQNIPQPQALWIKTHELTSKSKSKKKTLGGLPRKDSSSQSDLRPLNLKEDKERKQPVVHYQFTDTIVHQSESFHTETSQSHSQSYMGAPLSQIDGSVNQSESMSQIQMQNIDEMGEIEVEQPKHTMHLMN